MQMSHPELRITIDCSERLISGCPRSGEAEGIASPSLFNHYQGMCHNSLVKDGWLTPTPWMRSLFGSAFRTSWMQSVRTVLKWLTVTLANAKG
jgi:hypothetical protein